MLRRGNTPLCIMNILFPTLCFFYFTIFWNTCQAIIVQGRYHERREPGRNSNSIVFPAEEKNPCLRYLNRPALCVDVRTCPGALRSIRRGKQPIRCGWHTDYIPKVCCIPGQFPEVSKPDIVFPDDARLNDIDYNPKRPDRSRYQNLQTAFTDNDYNPKRPDQSRYQNLQAAFTDNDYNPKRPDQSRYQNLQAAFTDNDYNPKRPDRSRYQNLQAAFTGNERYQNERQWRIRYPYDRY